MAAWTSAEEWIILEGLSLSPDEQLTNRLRWTWIGSWWIHTVVKHLWLKKYVKGMRSISVFPSKNPKPLTKIHRNTSSKEDYLAAVQKNYQA